MTTIKTWQERRAEAYGKRAETASPIGFMEAELIDLRAALHAQQGDSERLDFIENCTVDLRCHSPQMPGCDDADVYWNVIEHYMAEPQEREIGWGNTARQAIDAALAARGEG